MDCTIIPDLFYFHFIETIIELFSHFLNRLKTQDLKALGQDHGRGLAKQDPAHVDLDNLAGLVLFHAVAVVVKDGEGGGHVVHELAQAVQHQVVVHLQQDLG